jgi:KaiC/GvpD/RAD55 family RecA-like ATPase
MGSRYTGLREALTGGANYSRFIKGELGTGKTMLAFEILTEFGGNHVVYLSTRISLPTRFQQFPHPLEPMGPMRFERMTSASSRRRHST